MKRRNAECGKIRRPVKRTKIAEGIYGRAVESESWNRNRSLADFGAKGVGAEVPKNTSTRPPAFVGQFEFEMKLK
ncbi:hypothetical protein X975_04179, partial [Stegodyphus mimosarum]